MRVPWAPRRFSRWRFPLASFVKQGADSVQEITDEVRKIISKQLKIPFERLAPDAPLQDLGLESLDLIEIIFSLEERFNINIPYNANEAAAAGNEKFASAGLGKLETVEQISAAVKELVAAKTSV
jgi:acyl carrier protein